MPQGEDARERVRNPVESFQDVIGSRNVVDMDSATVVTTHCDMAAYEDVEVELIGVSFDRASFPDMMRTHGDLSVEAPSVEVQARVLQRSAAFVAGSRRCELAINPMLPQDPGQVDGGMAHFYESRRAVSRSGSSQQLDGFEIR